MKRISGVTEGLTSENVNVPVAKSFKSFLCPIMRALGESSSVEVVSKVLLNQHLFQT